MGVSRGKIELGESAENALERELSEELGIRTRTGNYFDTSIYHYATVSIKLLAYNSTYVSGEITLTDHDQVDWVRITDLPDYDLAEADIPLVHKLIEMFKT
ncbi:(deoxy)nucleoside triphosphate pyrophosphohydrolase [Spirosoma telluris]|uniref:(deoxy)nucleoside triphosphate pyrophosphohydrolase n=1 Tax=Spirosoma telluris TaxID=2183553 RepID=UPI0038CD2DF4